HTRWPRDWSSDVCSSDLFTVVYVPKDASKSYPFLINRTPYSAGVYAEGELHYGEDWYPTQIGPSKEFEDAGYIFVKQDVRGRYRSEERRVGKGWRRRGVA